ncbi:MAG: ABC transporter permease, partial [Planococcus donghaensis]
MKNPLVFIKIILSVLVFLLMLLPFVPLILSSLSFGWQWPAILPESISFRAWDYVLFGSAGTWQAVGVS